MHTQVRRKRLRVDAWAMGAILALAVFVRMVGITFGLPHPMCRPDETSIVAVVNNFYGGDLNPRFFYYPAFFMLALYAFLLAWLRFGSLLGYVKGRAGMDALMTSVTVNQAARYLSAGAGVATVWVGYRIARRLFDRTSASIGALFLALAFLHVRDSHFGVTDVAATFLAMVAFLFVVRLTEAGRMRDLLAGAAAAGLAAATKYNLALIALPGLLAIVAPHHRTWRGGARLWRAGLFLLAMGAAFVAGAPYSLLEYGQTIAAIREESRHLVLGHGVILGRGWIVHLTSTLRYGLGLPMLVAGIGGLALLAARDARRGALVASFPLAYYLVLGIGYTVFARYMVPVVPFLCLAAGYAVGEAGRWLARRVERPDWAPFVAALIAVVVVAPSAWSVARFDHLLSLTDNRLIAAQWIEKRFPTGATIAQVGPEGGRVFVGAGDSTRTARYPSHEWSAASPDAEIIVVQSSPLFPGANRPAELTEVLTGYELAAGLSVASDETGVYDWQDEFYLPLSGLDGIARAGPNLSIYVRR